MSRKKAILIRYGAASYAYDVTDMGPPVPMDEKYLKQHETSIKCYTERHKMRILDRTLQQMDVTVIRVPSFVSNAGRKLRLPREGKREPTSADFSKGVRGLLDIGEIWENPFPGFWLISSMLTALRCDGLRRAGPDSLLYATEVRGVSQELTELFSRLIRMAAPKCQWEKSVGKRKNRVQVRLRVRREAVLDFRSPSPFSGIFRTVRDFAEVTVKARKRGAIHLPAMYEDTISIIIGADRKQLQDALPLMRQSYILLVNCAKTDGLKPSVIKGFDKVSNMDIVSISKTKAVEDTAPYITALLRRWWEWEADEELWADDILRKAKSHLAKPNGDYVSISPNPVKLRHAVQYEVLLSFIDFAVSEAFLSCEEAEQFCGKIRDAFYPEPAVSEARKRIEDPDVFPDLMRSIVRENTDAIVADGERFVKSEKKFGAIRAINGRQHLVIPEEKWAAAYRKAAKSAGMEISFCQRDDWERQVQRILSENGLIKATKGNPRYRYDLHGTGKKDSTYVVAFPWDDGKPQE